MRTLLSLWLLFLAAPAWCGHTLTAAQEKVLAVWLSQHAEYRLATDADCDCDGDIREMRTRSYETVPDYHPYRATGDFNGDGVEDFAVMVIDTRLTAANFTLVVFNGPFGNANSAPAFVMPGLARNETLFYIGPPHRRAYRLSVGHFNSDSGFTLQPSLGSYRTN